MKKALSLILALVLCLSLCACGSGSNGEANNTTNAPETSISKDDMLAAAETTNSAKINSDTTDNMAKAKQSYCGKTLEVTGFVLSIEDDHITLGAERYITTTVIDVYLPTDDLATLSKFQLVTIVGKTADTINERTKTVSGTDYKQKYFEMKQAYLVNNTFEATITLTVNEFGGGTIKAEANNCGDLVLTPFVAPETIKTTDYPKDCVTVLTVKGTIIYGDNNYYIQDYEITNTETAD